MFAFVSVFFYLSKLKLKAVFVGKINDLHTFLINEFHIFQSFDDFEILKNFIAVYRFSVSIHLNKKS